MNENCISPVDFKVEETAQAKENVLNVLSVKDAMSIPTYCFY